MLRQVSWLTGRCCCLAFPVLITPVELADSELSAHSCGGSPGMAVFCGAPDFLLALKTLQP